MKELKEQIKDDKAKAYDLFGQIEYMQQQLQSAKAQLDQTNHRIRENSEKLKQEKLKQEKEDG